MNCDRIIMTHLFPKTQQFEEKQDFLVSFEFIAKPFEGCKHEVNTDWSVSQIFDSEKL